MITSRCYRLKQVLLYVRARHDEYSKTSPSLIAFKPRLKTLLFSRRLISDSLTLNLCDTVELALFYLLLSALEVFSTPRHTHSHPFNGPFLRDYPGEQVPER